ncbi:hypothetical protein Avbf_02182 [Armadillidium vulgare]|nr:hypothetical protein Avbf_02182 [Armadillidium vulgare]
MDPAISIYDMIPMARSLDIVLKTYLRKKYDKVFLTVTNQNTSLTSFTTHSVPLEDYKWPNETIRLQIEGLWPSTEYTICPNLIDAHRVVAAEGKCQSEFTTALYNVNEKLIIAGITIGSILLLMVIGFLSYKLLGRGLKKRKFDVTTVESKNFKQSQETT